jgi:hypothetical protein
MYIITDENKNIICDNRSASVAIVAGVKSLEHVDGLMLSAKALWDRESLCRFLKG